MALFVLRIWFAMFFYDIILWLFLNKKRNITKEVIKWLMKRVWGWVLNDLWSYYSYLSLLNIFHFFLIRLSTFKLNCFVRLFAKCAYHYVVAFFLCAVRKLHFQLQLMQMNVECHGSENHLRQLLILPNPMAWKCWPLVARGLFQQSRKDCRLALELIAWFQWCVR